jgi:hypothetical protein
MVAETLKELRAALQVIEEQRRVEQELAERRRQIAILIGTSRAAIKAGRFADALNTLASARLIDEAADGLAELTEQALRGLSGEAVSMQRSDDDRNAADEDATRVILLDPSGNPRRPGEDGQGSSAAADRAQEVEDPNLTRIHIPQGVPSPESAERPGAAGRVWPWVLIVAASVLLILVLVGLYLYSRPAHTATYPVELLRVAVHRAPADPRLALPEGPAGGRALARDRRLWRNRRA